MSMWADYIAERKGAQIVEDEYGFASYYINPPNAYIEDIYVVAAKRQTHYASSMADKVVKKALESGCNTLYGSVNMGVNNPTLGMKALLGYGFELSHLEGNTVILHKEIKGD